MGKASTYMRRGRARTSPAPASPGLPAPAAPELAYDAGTETLRLTAPEGSGLPPGTLAEYVIEHPLGVPLDFGYGEPGTDVWFLEYPEPGYHRARCWWTDAEHTRLSEASEWAEEDVF